MVAYKFAQNHNHHDTGSQVVENGRKEEKRGKARPFFGIIDTDNYKSEVSQRLEIGFRPKEFNKSNYYKEINIENSDKFSFSK